MSEKQEYPQTEGNAVAGATKKKRGCGRHCKRFWWVYLIVLIVIIVIVVPVIILVAVPKIAQTKIDEAELEIQGVNVFETESNSYLMEINSTITTDGKIHAKIDSFEGDMYLEDFEPHTPFTTLLFPATTSDKHQVVNISQRLDITDMEAFTRFNVWFHDNETVRITVNGKTKVKPRGLTRKYEVNFKKTLEVKGLNHFKGTEVLDGDIAIEEDDNGNNFNGTVNIPNASHFTLDIGNVTFTNFIDDVEVGDLYINNLILHPGDNVLNITANMDQGSVISAARRRPYCETGLVPFKLLGKEVDNHGQNLTYFATALGSSNQTVEIDIGSILQKSLNTTARCADDD